MAKRANWRKVKRHRSYKVDQIAKLFAISKGTVRRWQKIGLQSVDDQKPALITGEALIAFLQGQSAKKTKCKPDECFCFTCRTPKKAAFGEADITRSNKATGMMNALCETCSALMYKRVSMAKLEPIQALLTVTFRQVQEPISNIPNPCLNDHFHKEPKP